MKPGARLRKIAATFSLLAALLIGGNASADTVRNYIVYQPDVSVQQLASQRLNAPVSDVNDAVVARGGKVVKHLQLVHGVLAQFSDSTFNAAAEKLAARGLAIEPDRPVHALFTPNDPMFSRQLDMPAINAPQAWDVTTGSKTVVVGVLDTGIDYDHPDLAANMWSDPVTGSHGWNFIANTADPMDDNGHGTHVAGTIGAVGNNGIGVTGVSQNVQLMALKVLGSAGWGYDSGIISGIQYAIEQAQRGVNIRVLNASLGGTDYTAAFQQAIINAYNAGILFVAAAGNDGTDNGVAPHYPSNYTNVLSVAATGMNGNLASFSNYDANTVQLAAPGVSILSTWPRSMGMYKYLTGTSMAAPHVAGAAALVASMAPTLTAGQLHTRLTESASMLPSLDGKVSSGLLNAAKALGADVLVRYTLTGQVTAKGKPLGGVLISDPALGTTTTDAAGRFRIDSLQAGTRFTLTASKVGYAFTPARLAGTVTENVSVALTAAVANVSIRGVIKSVKGEALAGVRVSDQRLGKATTDSRGSYQFASVPLGSSYTLTPTKSGYTFTPASVSGIANAKITANFTAKRR